MASNTTYTTDNILQKINNEIKRVKENHHNLKTEADKITDKLCSERDQASEERYQARIQSNSTKKELGELLKELSKATEELEKLKDLTEEEINSLVAERDDSNEEKLAFQLQHENDKKKLRAVEEKLNTINEEHRRLKEYSDKRSDQLVIERDNACNERYRARVRCDEINKKICEVDNKVTDACTQYDKLQEDTDDRISSLTAERDHYNDDLRKFHTLCKKKTIMFEDVHEDTLQDKTAMTETKNSLDTKNHRSNDSGIEIDVDVMREISTRMEIMLDEKLSNLGVKTKMITKDLTEPSTGIIASKMTDRETLHKNTRDENIIIHGIDESNEVGYDEIYLKKLLTVMEMGQTSPTLAHRLGMRKADRPRPMKITMESKDDKAKFMSKLGSLKYAATEYKKIRVTDDYTIEEREEIRRWVKMASNKNTTESNDNKGMMSYTWKVRGNPKTGLRIVKIRVQE